MESGVLFIAYYENVTHVGSVFFVGDKGEKVAEYSFDIQFNSWRMLVNRDRLEEFRQSLFAYLDYHVMKKDVDRNFLMKLHSRISELILRKVAEEKISTNDIFDQNYSYYDFMYSFDDTEKFKEMISKVLEKIRRLMGREEQNPVERVVSYIRENIEKDISVGVLADLIGVTPEYLSRVFKKVKGVSLKKYIINEKIEDKCNMFDYVFIDAPPSLSILTLNALVATDSVIIPIQSEFYALEGMADLLKTINLVESRLNNPCPIKGILITLYDPRTRLARDVVDNVKTFFKDTEYIFKEKIPRNVKLAEAPSHGQPCITYDPECNGTKSYMKLAEELIKLEGESNE